MSYLLYYKLNGKADSSAVVLQGTWAGTVCAFWLLTWTGHFTSEIKCDETFPKMKVKIKSASK